MFISFSRRQDGSMKMKKEEQSHKGSASSCDSNDLCDSLSLVDARIFLQKLGFSRLCRLSQRVTMLFRYLGKMPSYCWPFELDTG